MTVAPESENEGFSGGLSTTDKITNAGRYDYEFGSLQLAALMHKD